MPRGIILAAPASGSGKTVLTLAILRALKRRGLTVAGAKSGPDYIDPRFHEAACEQVSLNLDAWAMDGAGLRARATTDADLLVVEGAMGVLDGAGLAGHGSVADLAAALALPIVLVIDASKTAHSAGLAVAGLTALRPDLMIAGVILNKVGSDRHAAMVRSAVEAAGYTVFGTVARSEALALPERHLGLVQAREHQEIERFLGNAASTVETNVDLDALVAAADTVAPGHNTIPLAPLGQRIAIAHDDAFAFVYPHLLEDWRAQGAEVSLFSPLGDETPDANADAVYLPGGYPELYAGQLAAASQFHAGMQAMAEKVLIYGECGGFMVLGEQLEDAQGRGHAMLGLLPLETSFRARKLSLGYRRIADQCGLLWHRELAAHEFHYATVTREGAADRLFTATDADGEILPMMGLRRGRVCGSFAHVIGQMPSV